MRSAFETRCMDHELGHRSGPDYIETPFLEITSSSACGARFSVEIHKYVCGGESQQGQQIATSSTSCRATRQRYRIGAKKSKVGRRRSSLSLSQGQSSRGPPSDCWLLILHEDGTLGLD